MNESKTAGNNFGAPGRGGERTGGAKSGSAAADEPLPYAADGENARCRSGTKRKRTKATTRKNKDETRQTLVG